MPIILTETMVQHASVVARSLQDAFLVILDLPEVRGKRAATLTQELGVGRMTCQRISTLSKTPPNGEDPNPGLLTELPGVSGLRQFIDALGQRGTPKSKLAAAHTAINSFERFLKDIELSQTAFAEAWLLHVSATDPKQQFDRRAALFNAAAAVTGQSAEATVSMMAIRPSSEEGFNFEQVAVRGYVGMRASGSTMPIRMPINMAYSDYRNVTGDEAAREPQSLLPDFCSTPLPSIDTRVIKSEHLAHLINPEHIPTGEPFDCFATQHNQWNITNPGQHKAIWLYIDYPTRSCIFDLYLHRAIAERHSCSGDCHLWGTSLLAPPEDLWMTRFADQMEFSELGSGIQQSASNTYTRHEELSAFMFTHHGWDAHDFIGFRCEMAFPVWRSGVCVVLEEC